MKILIAIPCMDTVPAVFTQSLAMLQKIGDCAICMQVGSLVYDSRNMLAREAIRMKADYVFWLDSDMVFEPRTLIKLVEIATLDKLDFVSGVYYRRREPFTPVLFDSVEYTEEGFKTTEFEEIPEKLFEVGGCGFGCVLMKTQILLDVLLKYGDMFGPIERAGEDISFCWRARQLGYKIMAYPKVSLGHYSQQIVTKQFFDAYKGVNHADAGEKSATDYVQRI